MLTGKRQRQEGDACEIDVRRVAKIQTERMQTNNETKSERERQREELRGV